jgi:biopolymer transport protein ExbD/biopolymer transport protein TolR
MGFLRQKTEEPKVDLTPMVDVVFLLLIFFMISTTFVETPGISIQLPKSTATASPGKEDSIRVSVAADGALFLHTRNSPKPEPLTLAELKTLLKHYDEEEAGQMTFFLLADENSRHGEVVRVMDLARDAGFKKLVIGTQKERRLGP